MKQDEVNEILILSMNNSFQYASSYDASVKFYYVIVGLHMTLLTIMIFPSMKMFR